jgi:hypothetical protein
MAGARLQHPGLRPARQGCNRCPIRKLTGYQPEIDAIKSNYRPLLLSLSLVKRGTEIAMMDRLRSAVRTLRMTAVLICALSLAGFGTSHARPSQALQSTHGNGLPCNAVCKAYIVWSHRVTAMFHPSRPLKMPARPPQKIAAHHGRAPRMVVHHAPRTRGLNSFAQWPVPSDAKADSAGTQLAAEAPRATEAPQVTETPQVAEMPQAAEAPQRAERPQAAERAQAVEPPQAEVAPSRPIDQIADRFPAATEFMTAGRADTDTAANDAADSAVVAGANPTPANHATGAVDPSAHGADIRLVASLLLALCTLAGLRIWRRFKARRDADRDRISTFDQAIARARPKLRLVGVATELGPGA